MAERCREGLKARLIRGLRSAWGEFDEWIEARGHEKRADLWETYLEGPDSGGDPADWRTELVRPLADRGTGV
jgi:effector-binding domain-containing protein